MCYERKMVYLLKRASLLTRDEVRGVLHGDDERVDLLGAELAASDHRLGRLVQLEPGTMIRRLG